MGFSYDEGAEDCGATCGSFAMDIVTVLNLALGAVNLVLFAGLVFVTRDRIHYAAAFDAIANSGTEKLTTNTTSAQGVAHEDACQPRARSRTRNCLAF